MRKNIVLFIFLIGLIPGSVFASTFIFTHQINSGVILDAIALENGDQIILTGSGEKEIERLSVSYYDQKGAEIFKQSFYLEAHPQKAIFQICGGYIQILIDYSFQNADQLELYPGERFVFSNELIPQVCFERVLIPLVFR